MLSNGVDIVLNSRFNKLLDDEVFRGKVFHNSELIKKDKLISIFALKEATMKAIGRKLPWKDIEVSYEDSGKPIIDISNDIVEGKINISGSVSHDGEYTIAFVTIFENSV